MALRNIVAGVIGVGAFVPALLFAQELRIAGDSPTTINKPEAYRAYYSKLEGQPHTYTIQSDEPFRLSLRILAPHVADERTDFSATIFDKAQPNEPLIVLEGTSSEWTPFFDTAGRDDYLAGPPLRGGLAPGEYEIRVTNPDNHGAYVLVVGEGGGFSISSIFSRYSALPAIKSEFFGKPAHEAYLTPLLLRPVIGGLSLLAVLVFGAYILQKRRKRVFLE